MHKQGFTAHFVQAIRSLHQGTAIKILINNEASKLIKIIQCVRQGCCLSPIMFKLYINDLIKGGGGITSLQSYVY